jgi:hypothetical protein
MAGISSCWLFAHEQNWGSGSEIKSPVNAMAPFDVLPPGANMGLRELWDDLPLWEAGNPLGN